MAIVLAAATFGSPLLYVPGFGLLLAFAAAWLWVRVASRRVRLDYLPGPRTVIEGQPYPLKLVVRSAGLPFPGGTVTHQFARNPVRIDPRPGSPAELEITSLRRGWRRIDPATLVVADPLGLASARVRATSSPSVLVLPRIEHLVLAAPSVNGSDDAIPGGVHSSHGAGLGKRALDFEVDGLRAYRPGSPASRIHWPILARTGDLVERRLVGGADASPIVVVDAERPIDSSALDRAVRAAASLCFHLAPAAGCVLVLPGERAPLRIDPELRAWPQAHARLAMVEPSGSPPDSRIVRRAGTVFWVSATGTIPRLPPAIAGTTRYLVTATAIDLGEPAFTVAGCEGRLAGKRIAAKARAA